MIATTVEIVSKFLLDDASIRWQIEHGSVDLYLVNVSGDEIRSRLEHVVALEAGALLCGLGMWNEGGITSTLVAQATLGTRLRAWTFEESGGAKDALEHWIGTMTAACTSSLPPSDCTAVEAHTTFRTGEEAMQLVSAREVVWVSSEPITPRLFGTSSMYAAAVPVTRHAWVKVEPGNTVYCRSNEAWAESETVEQDLYTFHTALLQQLVLRRQSNDASEALRFEEKLHRDSRLFGNALQELTTPLHPLLGNVLHVLRGHSHGALDACRAIGQRMSVEFHEPKEGVDRNPSIAVEHIAFVSGVRYRSVALRHGWWKLDSGPMVGFTLDRQRAVALLPIGSNAYEADLEGTGIAQRITPEKALGLDTNAYVLYRRLPARKLVLKDVLDFGLRTVKADLAVIGIVSACTALLGLAIPIATSTLFDSIIPEGHRSNLVQLSIILFAVSVATFLMNLGQSFAVQRMESRMQAETQAALWDRLLALPTTFYRRFSSADLAMRSLTINQIRHILTGTVIAGLLSSVLGVFSYALLFKYSLRLALLATELAAVAIAFSAFSTWVMIRLDRKVLTMDGQIAGGVTELLAGIAKFRTSGTEPRAFARWAHAYTWQKRTVITATKIGVAMGIFNTVFPVATSILIYLAAADLAKTDPTFSTGRFLAFNATFHQFLGAALGFSSAILSVVAIIPKYERALPILEEVPELGGGRKIPPAMQGDIELSHVRFRYGPDGPLVVNDVSFRVRAGNYVAVVGESGSGKSTLLRLLLGFECPEGGSILYDGMDLAEIDLPSLRKQFGVVLQDGKIMPTEIFSNIIGNSLLTMEDAWDAARRVGLDEDIRSMPMGMHTVLNESGGGLSGGQKQRILIARAVVHRPRIIFFDEATSALDNRTQAIVSRSLEQMQATRIVIAHRLSTVMNADMILVMQHGEIVESGTYAKLLAAGGYFADLASRQIG